MNAYLRPSPGIDCNHPAVANLACALVAAGPIATTRRYVTRVRTELWHRVDANPAVVTCNASGVLAERRAFCCQRLPGSDTFSNTAQRITPGLSPPSVTR